MCWKLQIENCCMRFENWTALLCLGVLVPLSACQENQAVTPGNTFGWGDQKMTYDDIRFDMERGILHWPKVTTSFDGDRLAECTMRVWNDADNDSAISVGETVLERAAMGKNRS